MELKEKFKQHMLWVETAGEAGKQFDADELDMHVCDVEDLKNLTASFLSECVFNNMNIEDISLDHSEMYSCKMVNTKLNHANFEKIDARFLDFTEATINNSTFHDADLDEVSFKGAVLENVSFVGANLWDCDFTNATLINVDFNEAALYNVTFKNTVIKNPLNVDNLTNISVVILKEDEELIISGKQATDWIKSNISG